MGSAYKLKDHLDRAPFSSSLGNPQYWPPEMVEGSTHHVGYDIYGLGLLLLECRTAQPPFKHLIELPWEKQRVRRTFEELVKCGTCMLLTPGEQQFLEKCLQFDQLMRPHALELFAKDAYMRTLPSR
jgi:serine/threonine protein kinase